MKSRWLILASCVALLFAVAPLIAKTDPADKKFKATCPVSGKPAGESHMVELKNGDKVYFCCDNCPKAFKRDPKKFDAKVHRQLLETGQVVQVACPFTGKPVNKATLVAAGDAEVGFCCKNCLAKYNKADDAKKVSLVFADAPFEKGFTRQTKCPVSGKPINPEHMVEYRGKKVYFCCPNCPKAFEANPAKYVAKLPQFARERGGESKQ